MGVVFQLGNVCFGFISSGNATQGPYIHWTGGITLDFAVAKDSVLLLEFLPISKTWMHAVAMHEV